MCRPPCLYALGPYYPESLPSIDFYGSVYWTHTPQMAVLAEQPRLILRISIHPFFASSTTIRQKIRLRPHQQVIHFYGERCLIFDFCIIHFRLWSHIWNHQFYKKYSDTERNRSARYEILLNALSPSSRRILYVFELNYILRESLTESG